LRRTHSIINQDRWDLELKIHQKENYFGCSGRMHRDLILKNNLDAIIFKMFFPLEKPTLVKEVPKEFDFVFFAAGVNNKKGVEDAIDAFAIVKKQKPTTTLNIVGGCNSDYKLVLEEKIKNLNLERNIIFNGYFAVHADMHQHIKKSRFAVLPNKLDIISGTVLEAILLEIPLITYKTSGSPFLNKNGETILLADIGDTEKLAENMLRLLNKPELAEKLKRDAKTFVEKEFDNTTSAKRLLGNYKAVIDHYHQNIPIPKNLLFDTEEFPIY
jgi:glycosyltransferase involved in cell wall biosynthesis